MRVLIWSPADERPDIRAASGAGFDGIILSGLAQGQEQEAVSAMAPDARSAGLRLIVEVALDSFPIGHELVERSPEAFSLRRAAPDEGPVDPRKLAPATGEARARLRDPRAAEQVFPAIEKRLTAMIEAGAGGFLLQRPDSLSAQLLDRLRQSLPRAGDPKLLVSAPGAPRDHLRTFGSVDGILSSFGYWDLRSPWIAEEYEALRLVAPLLSAVEAGQSANADPAAAALLGNGVAIPSRLFRQQPEAVERALSLSRTLEPFDGEMRLMPAGDQATAILRSDRSDLRSARRVVLGLLNRSANEAAAVEREALLPALSSGFEPFRALEGEGDPFAPLAPAELRLLVSERSEPVLLARSPGGGAEARKASEQPRLVIERVSPEVDGGAFPAKRTVGETVDVEAVFFGEGHDQLAAELLWRPADSKHWSAVRMEDSGNDRWTASFTLERLGRHEFQVVGWLDRFGGFRRDYAKKRDAGVAQSVDRQEGARMVEDAAGRSSGPLAKRLKGFVGRIAKAGEAEASDLLLDAELALLMDEADDRPFAVRSRPRLVEAERLQARFSSWYELFPRSQTDDPARHGTFDDVIARLPQIRDMGFDTLYFPPIHPIGRKHRKGRNNTLTPAPEDPGSPYAIGSAEGGHTAIHPELGTIEDFRRLVEEARRHGMELALDFAIQCSPDHPWLEEHPGWFDWRPDGTIKYAENPPKKYQDIVNVDFYRRDSIPDLWLELRDVILFWIDQGVKTFRVDNPHTKPFPFWEWMIADVRALHPDVIFLSEAFTRPAVMYRLAKVGFSQSYTYFTWRNTKAELTEYLTELNETEAREFFRPHFFVNTPDINPTFLHTSGRAGFRIRAILAGTLSGLFGVYSGFELCESEPVPGKEEYWESEKYEVKPRDWQAPGNIIEDIRLINRLRRAYPALQSHLGLTFYNAWNDGILLYGKRAPGSSTLILVAVSLDPHNVQEADFEIPLWEWGLGDQDGIAVEDLVEGHRFDWTGKVQHVRLTPDQPYRIWRLSAGGAA